MSRIVSDIQVLTAVMISPAGSGVVWFAAVID